MAYTDTTWTPVLVTETDMNTSVRDNFRFFYTGVGFAATKATQSVASGAYAKAQCNTEVWDSHGYYDNATNFRFTPLVAGKYRISVSAMMATVNGDVAVQIYKNGAASEIGQLVPLSGVRTLPVSACGILDMNGSTDYIEMMVLHNTGSNQNINSYFSAERVGT
jgi:hypothetical protein